MVRCLLSAAAIWFVAALPAGAYPSSAIFVPTGNVVAAGEGQLNFYNAYYGSLTSSWAGVVVGLLPEIPYGNSGLVFGGLEAGFDVIGQAGQDPAVKPIGSMKLGLLREYGWAPDLGVGVMSVAFLHRSRSLDFAYGAASKTVTVGGRELGRATLGLGHALPTADDQYEATWPLPGNESLMVAYEFPSVGPFSFAIDHLGGISEVSGTNIVVNVELVPGTFASIGYSFSNDRKDPQPDGYFFQTYTNFDFPKAFGPRRAEPADSGEAEPS